jgi:streptogramin lyase
LANRGVARTAATLSGPFGVYSDPAGNLWVSDFNNARVLRYNAATSKPNGGDADLVLGQANFTASSADIAINTTVGPSQLSEGPDGSILIPDFSVNRVLRFDPVNVAPTITLTGPARRTSKRPNLVITGSAADSDGSLASVKGGVNNGAFTNAAGTASWRFTAKLKPGRNTVTVRAFDNLGLASGFVTVSVTRK